MSGLPALFLLVDGVMKLFKPPIVVEATVELGYPESVIVGLGVTLLTSTLLYLIPRTSILGAILLSGYLGGAVATHVRVGGPIFNIVFAVIVGALLWGGLWLRDGQLREMLPFGRFRDLDRSSCMAMQHHSGQEQRSKEKGFERNERTSAHEVLIHEVMFWHSVQGTIAPCIPRTLSGGRTITFAYDRPLSTDVGWPRESHQSVHPQQ